MARRMRMASKRRAHRDLLVARMRELVEHLQRVGVVVQRIVDARLDEPRLQAHVLVGRLPHRRFGGRLRGGVIVEFEGRIAPAPIETARARPAACCSSAPAPASSCWRALVQSCFCAAA